MKDLWLGFIVGVLTGWISVAGSCASSVDECEKTCRHAIQVNFNKTRQEAEQILKNQQKWERE